MKHYAPKIGAIFYILWGLLHIAGGASLLQQLSTAGVTGVLATLGSALPPTELPAISVGVTSGVLAFFAWNWIWLGLFVLVIAAMLNWRNSRLGYWINMGVVAAADLGLIVTLLVPGYMALTDGWPGPLLWVLAAIFSTWGLLNSHPQAERQATLA